MANINIKSKHNLKWWKIEVRRLIHCQGQMLSLGDNGIFLCLVWTNRFMIYLQFYYRPQRSCGQGNIFTPVCHSVHRGGLLQCMLGYHPPGPDPTPPEPDPRDQTPPGADAPQSRPPREAASSVRSTSGRYASYWNAFLFHQFFIHL